MKVTILDKPKLNKKTIKTLDTIYNTLLQSYGPLGGNTIIHRNGDIPSVTKDGFTILKSLRFDSGVEFDIYRLIYTISSNLVDKVGDGSTSSVISAIHLYKSLMEGIDNSNVYTLFKHNRDMIDTLNLIQKILVDIIDIAFTKSVPNELEEKEKILTTLATLSNNNNKEIGKELGKIIAGLHKDSVVQIKENPMDGSDTITYHYNSGFQVKGDIRVSHPLYFSRNEHKQELVLPKGAYVVMTYNLLEVHYNYLLKDIIPVATKAGLPVVLIAETVQTEVKAQIIRDAMVALNSNKLPSIVLLEANDLSQIRNLETFSDLEAYLGCNAIKFNAIGSDELESIKDEELDIVGFAKCVTLKTNNTIIFDGGSGTTSRAFSELTEKLYNEYTSTPIAQKLTRGNLSRRLNRLNGANATIYVGGRTQEEKENAKYLVEDSVLACMNAIKYGYTIGSNLAAYYAIELLVDLISYNGSLKDKLVKLVHNDNILDMDMRIDSLILDIYHLRDSELLHDVYDNTSNPLLTLLYIIKNAYYGVVNVHKSLDYRNIYSASLCEIRTKSIYNFVNNVTDYLPNVEVYNVYTNQLEYFPLASKTTIPEGKETTVISPMKTDVEILNASFAILTLLLSTNQYIS